MAIYAIGDLQGCFDELQTLLAIIKFSPHSDQLWFVGDLVNRGPQSLQSLQFVHRLSNTTNAQGQPVAQTVLGNHDLHLIACAYGARQPGKLDTLDDILNHPDCDALIHWLKKQPLLHHLPDMNFCMTHAGIPPTWTLEDAKIRAQAASNHIRHCPQAHFGQLFSNTPDIWSSELADEEERAICTINCLTRMRFIQNNGRLDLKLKVHPDEAPSDRAPWFSHNHHPITGTDSSDSTGTRIVFGHWAALQGETDNPLTFAIDTGCVWGNRLTALRLNDLKRYSVPNQRER